MQSKGVAPADPLFQGVKSIIREEVKDVLSTVMECSPVDNVPMDGASAYVRYRTAVRSVHLGLGILHHDRKWLLDAGLCATGVPIITPIGTGAHSHEQVSLTVRGNLTADNENAVGVGGQCEYARWATSTIEDVSIK
jgi:hypothetical protein